MKNNLEQNSSSEAFFARESSEGETGRHLSSKETAKKLMATAGVGALATASAYGIYRYGTDIAGVLDTQIIPTPTVYPAMVDGFVAANESLRQTAPAILAGGLMARGAQKLYSKSNEKSSTIEDLSGQEYTGVDAQLETKGKGLFDRARKQGAKITAGMGVASLAIVLSGAFSGLEKEIADGPLRPVDQFVDVFADEEADTHFIFQSSSTTFMDDSYLPVEPMQELVVKAGEENIDVIPFSKALPNIDNRSGLAVSLPDSVFEEATGHAPSEACENIPIILDEANTKNPGETVSINGLNTVIAEKMSDTAQMNRDIAVMPESDFKDCLQKDEHAPYFGAIMQSDAGDSENTERMTTLVEESQFDEASLVSEQEFKESNRRFWRANGTPLLLQMITYMGIFSAFAIGSERRGMLQRNVREIGTLNAAGVSMKDIRNIELRRALKETNKATLLAAPLLPVVAGVFNMATVGLKAGAGLRELSVGYSIALAAKTTGSLRAVRRFSKKLDLPDAVRG